MSLRTITSHEIAYALDGKSEEALKWLRLTVNEGFTATRSARESFLDPIRKDPAFVQFIAEMKTVGKVIGVSSDKDA